MLAHARYLLIPALLFSPASAAQSWNSWEDSDTTVTKVVTSTHYVCPCDTSNTGWFEWSTSPSAPAAPTCAHEDGTVSGECVWGSGPTSSAHGDHGGHGVSGTWTGPDGAASSTHWGHSTSILKTIKTHPALTSHRNNESLFSCTCHHVDDVDGYDRVSYIDYVNAVNFINFINAVKHIDYISNVSLASDIDSAKDINFVKHIDDTNDINFISYIKYIDNNDTVYHIGSIDDINYIHEIDSVNNINIYNIKPINNVKYIDRIDNIYSINNIEFDNNFNVDNDNGSTKHINIDFDNNDGPAKHINLDHDNGSTKHTHHLYHVDYIRDDHNNITYSHHLRHHDSPAATSSICSAAQAQSCAAASGDQCICNVRPDGVTPVCTSGGAYCLFAGVTCSTDADCEYGYTTCVKNDGLFGAACTSPNYCGAAGTCAQPAAGGAKRNLEDVFRAAAGGGVVDELPSAAGRRSEFGLIGGKWAVVAYT
ncbi:uncharacterized protein Z520_08505 [Fonsecaea multimorphosa CBS 102226]|uniref:EGF-like domain-containing protein n=1 Tax=Fonsecaea multimorphosa CBS 102226 TaxID=1442371 RepID=A0A0D2JR06_9EURO|nr:uncharacterized protein Z520_08505 [Fonsecaea multimorphosa CBS 102226]KIX95797.1 hypothetical protein Z520_08505 [Fonsecaea multimorphosa CBS 102226]OAL21533.1 hypothetical protein AYO22_07929 [Fonsecaea multimorphosa]